MNWPMKTDEEKVLYSPAEYSKGVLTLARRVRESIRAIKPDAIVMGESTSGALGRVWDGGLSADFAWLAKQNQNKLVGSPARYAMPELNIFSNGRDRNEFHQVFAAGLQLALLNANLPDADYVRKLVKIRQEYKDALIYGKQLYQPFTGDDDVVAYYYRGAASAVVTVVNLAASPYAGHLSLRSEQPTLWKDLLNGGTQSTGGNSVLAIPGRSLCVLARHLG